MTRISIDSIISAAQPNNALDRYALGKYLSDLASNIMKEAKDEAMVELKFSGEEKLDTDFGTLSIRKNAAKYDYSGSPQWTKLQDELDAYKSKVKNTEKRLVESGDAKLIQQTETLVFKAHK